MDYFIIVFLNILIALAVIALWSGLFFYLGATFGIPVPVMEWACRY